MKGKNIGIGLIIIFVVFVISTTAIISFLLYKDTIHDGVTIENLDVSGLSAIEAQVKIKNHFDQVIKEGKIHFTYDDQAWDVYVKDIGFTYDYINSVNKAYDIGRKGNILERVQQIFSLYGNPYNIELESSFDHSKVDEIVQNMQKKIDKPPKNASIVRKNGQFVITKEEKSYNVNVTEVKSQLEEKLKEYKYQDEIYIELLVQTVLPKITAESLRSIDALLSEYVTKFNPSSINRSFNVRLAAKTMNGTVIMPGEIFSFNEVVGPRSVQRGYKSAHVIFKGELVDGLGGGVCQPSSTLYNATLLANLEIVERTKHTIPSSYVPKGRDATVSYGVLDFKFKNIFAHPIYLESYTHRNLMIVKLYGASQDRQNVQIQSKDFQVIKRPVEVKYNDQLFEGEEEIEEKGRDGYKVTTYRIVYENNRMIRKERISKDYYRPQKQIVIKGTKKRAPVVNIQEDIEGSIEGNIQENIEENIEGDIL